MGMSTYVVGFAPPDDKWKKMKKVYDACEKAGLEIPDEVDDFFNGEPPDDAGVEVDLREFLREHLRDGQDGFEIDIADIPKQVKTIRFINSY